MRIFITGATGFIGSHLVKRLGRSGHELVCLVLEGDDTSALEGVGAAVVRGDVTERESLLRGMAGCDWVVNLANIYSFWEPDSSIYTLVNVVGTRNVMESALETGASKVLHISTSLVYGKPEDRPFKEESLVGPVRRSEYSRTKYAGELIAWELHDRLGLPLVMVHPTGVIGPGDTKVTGQYIDSMLNGRLPATAFEDVEMTLVYVGDVVEVIVRALECEDNLGEKYLIGKHTVTFRELNGMISEISGVTLPGLSLPDSVVRLDSKILTWVADTTGKPPLWMMSFEQVASTLDGWIADGSKAERELGISYTPIRHAVEETIAWYRGTLRPR